MTLPFLVRLIFVGLIRFIGLIGLLLWYQNFEVSPLPAWTLDVFIFLVQFAWTFLCTRWVLRRVFPTPRMLTLLAVFFIVGQVILELALTRKLTGQTWGETIRGAAHWGALFQIALHLGAIYLSYWRLKRVRLQQHAEEQV